MEESVRDHSFASRTVSDWVAGPAFDHRILQASTDPISTLVLFLFGAVIMAITCALARSHRLQQQHAEAQRLEEYRLAVQKAHADAETRRQQVLKAFEREHLVRVLKASDIEVPIGRQFVGTSADVETGHLTAEKVEEDTTQSLHGQGEIIRTGGPSDYVGQGEIIRTGGPSGVAITWDNSEEEDSNGVTEPVLSLDRDRDETDFGKVTVTRGKEQLSLSITCAICLERYKEGDKIVLSGNTDCSHGFHQRCILDYFVQKGEQAAPCPCCRQIFLPLNVIKQGWWKEKATGNSNTTGPTDDLQDINNP